MFGSSSCKNILLQIRWKNNVFVLQNPTFLIRFLSQIPSNSTNSVDFLVSSCGLSLEKATIAAKKIRPNFKPENPTSVLKLLETTGFSKTHITKIISICPRLLFSSVVKTLKPKIQLFHEMGFSDSQVADLMVSKPGIFFRSGKCQIIPSLESIRSFVKTDENMIRVIKRSKLMLGSNPSARLEPNVSILRDCNVPDSRIAYLMMTQPGVLMLKAGVLKKTIESLKKLGFKPESRMFTVAMHAKCSMSELTWNSKVNLLKEWGWSEEQILDAFKRVPIFMTCSETKMKEGLDFFSKTLNWDASVLSKYPKCLLFSLRLRVMPRVKLFNLLKSKKVLGTEKEVCQLTTVLDMTEKEFLEKFVAKYQDELPDLQKKHKDLGETVSWV